MFITFEGIEGCGKTTQIRRLAEHLQKKGVPVLETLEPGGSPIGMKIRKILLDSAHQDLTPLAELILYMADRAQHVETLIRPALDRGKWVLCDRYSDATVVYQGAARGQDMSLIRDLNRKVTGGLRPDRTFLLDCPVETGLERAFQRNAKADEKTQDRFEREKIEFHRAVRKGYLDLAAGEPHRFVIIDAMQEKDDVEKSILAHVETLLQG